MESLKTDFACFTILLRYIISTINFALMMSPFYNESAQPWKESEHESDTALMSSYSLIVWNDEVNTFEWVIETLIKICAHIPEQAEQCAMFIHTKGKYGVKNGEYEVLKPMCDAITDRGIGATIEAVAG
jgi:ATP-dependent Clp protease adaptor protein ClpS